MEHSSLNSVCPCSAVIRGWNGNSWGSLRPFHGAWDENNFPNNPLVVICWCITNPPPQDVVVQNSNTGPEFRTIFAGGGSVSKSFMSFSSRCWLELHHWPGLGGASPRHLLPMAGRLVPNGLLTGLTIWQLASPRDQGGNGKAFYGASDGHTPLDSMDDISHLWSITREEYTRVWAPGGKD